MMLVNKVNVKFKKMDIKKYDQCEFFIQITKQQNQFESSNVQ